MTVNELFVAAFAAECLSPHAQLTLAGQPAAVLTDGGRLVRLAILADPKLRQWGLTFLAPLTNQSFRSLMTAKELPPFLDRMGPSSATDLLASPEDQKSLWDFSRSIVRKYEYKVFEDLPNLHQQIEDSPDLLYQVRSHIEYQPAPVRAGLIEFIAPFIWALAHRPDHEDFLLLAVNPLVTSHHHHKGYIQMKSCGGRKDPFGRVWVYAESQSVHQKEREGTPFEFWHASVATALGWNSSDRVGNDFGVFYLDTPIQAAMLAELVVDSLICLHGMDCGAMLELTSASFQGGGTVTATIAVPPPPDKNLPWRQGSSEDGSA